MLTMGATVQIGVDLGGTKIEAMVLGFDGIELDRRRAATPKAYDDILRCICQLVGACEEHVGQTGTVGVGTPGTLSPATGLMKNANTVCLIGKPLDRDLAAALGRPVRLANDANCFALSEATDGAAAGAAVVFGVIVGTGTGGGLVVNGAILNGPNAIAGEWGHNPLPWPQTHELPGPACYCGKLGCIETFLSGPGMTRDHERATGLSLSAADIATHADSGDDAAMETLRRYEDRMARALASVINVLDPNVIVLGGGVSNIGRLTTEVPRLWQRYVFSDSVATHLVRAAHGDSGGVRGAAWLWS
jgi:fructokinase